MSVREFASHLAERAARRQWGWLVLFVSSATLVCCALPIVLVALGLGAVSAALFANLPFLVAIAEHKAWLFAGSGVLLVLGGWALFRTGRTCPADPVLAAKCEAARRWNRRLFLVSVLLWTAGVVAAYLSLPLLHLFEGKPAA